MPVHRDSQVTKHLTTDDIYLMPYERGLFVFFNFLYVLFFCSSYIQRILFESYVFLNCVNAALYTQTWEISPASRHCWYILSPLSGCDLSRRGRHSVKPNELISRVTSRSVTLTRSPKCCNLKTSYQRLSVVTPFMPSIDQNLKTRGLNCWNEDPLGFRSPVARNEAGAS